MLLVFFLFFFFLGGGGSILYSVQTIGLHRTGFHCLSDTVKVFTLCIHQVKEINANDIVHSYIKKHLIAKEIGPHGEAWVHGLHYYLQIQIFQTYTYSLSMFIYLFINLLFIIYYLFIYYLFIYLLFPVCGL